MTGTSAPSRLRGLGDADQRRAQVALHVDAERLERRDVEHAGAVPRVRRAAAWSAQPVERPEERRQGLARSGRRDDERVRARTRSRPTRRPARAWAPRTRPANHSRVAGEKRSSAASIRPSSRQPPSARGRAAQPAQERDDVVELVPRDRMPESRVDVRLGGGVRRQPRRRCAPPARPCVRRTASAAPRPQNTGGRLTARAASDCCGPLMTNPARFTANARGPTSRRSRCSRHRAALREPEGADRAAERSEPVEPVEHRAGGAASSVLGRRGRRRCRRLDHHDHPGPSAIGARSEAMTNVGRQFGRQSERGPARRCRGRASRPAAAGRRVRPRGRSTGWRGRVAAVVMSPSCSAPTVASGASQKVSTIRPAERRRVRLAARSAGNVAATLVVSTPSSARRATVSRSARDRPSRRPATTGCRARPPRASSPRSRPRHRARRPGSASDRPERC